MAKLASERGLFGGNCTFDRVLKEMRGYSDHQLHTFSSESLEPRGPQGEERGLTASPSTLPPPSPSPPSSPGSWPAHLAEFMLPDSALMGSAKMQLLDSLVPSLFAAGSKVRGCSMHAGERGAASA